MAKLGGVEGIVQSDERLSYPHRAVTVYV